MTYIPPAERVLSDPMEEIVRRALVAAGIRFHTDQGGGNPSGLDFVLPDLGIEIEVKRFHSPRIADQMARAENVVAIQGEVAVRWMASLLNRTMRPDAPADERGSEGL